MLHVKEPCFLLDQPPLLIKHQRPDYPAHHLGLYGAVACPHSWKPAAITSIFRTGSPTRIDLQIAQSQPKQRLLPTERRPYYSYASTR